MYKTPVGHRALWALAAVYLGMLTTTATAGSFTRGCAARDIQVLMLIEERESADAISAQKSNDAILTLLHARMLCYEGRVLDALSLYDDITQSLTIQFGRAQ
jgi:hypothetical protein